MWVGLAGAQSKTVARRRRLLLLLRRFGMAVTRSVGTQVLQTYGLHSYGAALLICQREAYHEFRTAAVRAIL
jgi:hypothetical protein